MLTLNCWEFLEPVQGVGKEEDYNQKQYEARPSVGDLQTKGHPGHSDGRSAGFWVMNQEDTPPLPKWGEEVEF